MEIVLGLFLIAMASVLGGLLAKSLKLPSLVGYIIAGIVFGAMLPESFNDIVNLAQIGTILLLFSIGIELSFDSLTKYFKVAIFGSLIQIVLVTLSSWFIMLLFGFNSVTSFILALGFSLSSTAVVVKILAERGEGETVHGGVMLGWLLVQDLAVIPIMVFLPLLGNLSSGWVTVLAISLLKAIIVVIVAVVMGKIVFPIVIHKVAEANSRELLLLSSIALALGTATATSYFGISPSLGAFLAGIVISESQEHHAIFAETRPLRDLFVALFFVSLGFLVNPAVIFSKFFLIILLAAIVLLLKAVIVFFVSVAFGYRGKTAIANSFGLAQVGEFAFVIFSVALSLNLLSPENTSLGISVTLVTLMVSPILIKYAVPAWRKFRDLSSGIPVISAMFSSGEKHNLNPDILENHIIICGYGRVGKWVGKALTQFSIPFIVVEYNQKIVNELKDSGVAVLYGDPTEPEVLEAVGIRGASAIVLAIPDRIAQETLIAYTQSVAPNVKIISRAHLDEDWEKLRTLRVDKVVQPEFEAALEIIRTILPGKRNSDDVESSLRSLRMSHSRN
ncbi:MAG TPA: cation:proton antiporter [Patescibacteria group bacterium]|nr:cation:proton antiporter [Patescibacteria group bacterium]